MNNTDKLSDNTEINAKGMDRVIDQYANEYPDMVTVTDKIDLKDGSHFQSWCRSKLNNGRLNHKPTKVQDVVIVTFPDKGTPWRVVYVDNVKALVTATTNGWSILQFIESIEGYIKLNSLNVEPDDRTWTQETIPNRLSDL